MKNCCFCWSPVGDLPVEIQSGWRMVIDATSDAGRLEAQCVEFAHEDCFERSKSAYRTATLAMATMRGGR